jgi:HEPN domain-containing protein
MRPVELVMEELVQQWLQKADEDLAVARHLIGAGSFSLAAVAFHSQQAAEKFLEAFLVHRQIEFPKTHEMGKLLDLVAQADSQLAASLGAARTLTPYGVDIRYPDDFPDITPDAARAAADLASMVGLSVKTALERTRR